MNDDVLETLKRRVFSSLWRVSDVKRNLKSPLERSVASIQYCFSWQIQRVWHNGSSTWSTFLVAHHSPFLSCRWRPSHYPWPLPGFVLPCLSFHGNCKGETLLLKANQSRKLQPKRRQWISFFKQSCMNVRKAKTAYKLLLWCGYDVKTENTLWKSYQEFFPDKKPINWMWFC